jgi:vancomycin permeability regulator SanA
LSVIIINIFVLSFSRQDYYTQIKDTPENYIGLVFGAAVKGKYKPSDILSDRLNVAYDAYVLGKIDKIIVSGDNRESHYNEPVAMQKYLLDL